jgi:hypothetical protein
MSDGSLWQGLVLCALGLPFANLPQRGTVTASALDLAFSLTRGDVVISGTDLAVNDIRIHASPYSFERLLEEKANRFLPLYSQYFTRTRAITSGKSHDIYAAWFRSHIAEWPKRFYSLGSNSPAFSAIPAWNGPAHSYAAHGLKNIRFPQAELVKAAVSFLLGALSSAAIRRELTSLLFPDAGSLDTVSLADLECAIRVAGARHAIL